MRKHTKTQRTAYIVPKKQQKKNKKKQQQKKKHLNFLTQRYDNNDTVC